MSAPLSWFLAGASVADGIDGMIGAHKAKMMQAKLATDLAGSRKHWLEKGREEGIEEGRNREREQESDFRRRFGLRRALLAQGTAAAGRSRPDTTIGARIHRNQS